MRHHQANKHSHHESPRKKEKGEEKLFKDVIIKKSQILGEK